MRVPKLCTHKSSGLAYVTDPLTKAEVYLGRAGTPEAEAAYRRWLAGFLKRPEQSRPRDEGRRRGPGRLTVAALWGRYLEHARAYYVKRGEPTSEVGILEAAAAYCLQSMGKLAAEDITPQHFKAWRQELIAADLARNTVNKYAGRLRRCVRWAVSEGLLPPAVLAGLQAVPDVAPFRGGRETEDVGPVPLPVVEATLPLLRPALRALVRFTLAAGCRPGEAVRVRPRDLDRTSCPWLYVPYTNKNEHRGLSRRIWLGPAAREALAPLLAAAASPDAWLWPGSTRMGHLDPGCYGEAVSRAARGAGVPHWHPSQLRHSQATLIRSRHDLEAAQAVLGHDNPQTTLRYAERLDDLARRVVEELG